jgi:hypothetical protein
VSGDDVRLAELRRRRAWSVRVAARARGASHNKRSGERQKEAQASLEAPSKTIARTR